MKPKTRILILMAVAIVCGLVASYMISRLISEHNETVLAVVAKKDFSTGTLVKQPEEMFEKREILQRGAPKRFITVEAETLERLRNRVLVRPLNEGDVLSEDDLLSEEQEKHLRIVALAARIDSLEGHVHLFRWVLGLIGVIVFLNIIRKSQLGRIQRRAAALIEILAVALLLEIAIFQPPPSWVLFGVLLTAGLLVIRVVLLELKADSGSSSTVPVEAIRSET